MTGLTGSGLEAEWAALEATAVDLACRVRAVQPPSWRGPASEACATGLLRAVADLDRAAEALARARRAVRA
ncbi:hypothetical protein [Aquipuribacter sp. SD81]|uniref:hypothetical protein n=1 Tax=Aquipuribacter sp. SD81 TaxID=3127703 RepID=UPI0030173FB8